MSASRIPCPTCAGTAWASHGDRHARTAKDLCQTCKGEGTVEAQTGAVRTASFDPETGRPFGDTGKAARPTMDARLDLVTYAVEPRP